MPYIHLEDVYLGCCLSKLEEFKDTNGAIRNRISKKNRQHNGQKNKSTRGQTTIDKTYI